MKKTELTAVIIFMAVLSISCKDKTNKRVLVENIESGDNIVRTGGKIVVTRHRPDKDAEFTAISAEEAKRLIEKSKPLILDVRTPGEYYEGHIRNSKLMPLQQLEDRISEIEDYKDKEIIIYCRSGNRSTAAAEILIKNGFKKIYHIGGGILEWINEGYRIEQ